MLLVQLAVDEFILIKRFHIKKAAIKLRLFNLVARPGFEPRQTAPKTVVLPLYYQAIRPFISEWAAKIGGNLKFSKYFRVDFH
jgi:hypothetical protein